MLSLISAIVLTPHNPMVVSISLAMMSRALATPACPPAPRPIGLGAGGQAGVAKALDIIAKEMLTTMGLCGVNTIAEIDDNILAV